MSVYFEFTGTHKKTWKKKKFSITCTSRWDAFEQLLKDNPDYHFYF